MGGTDATRDDGIDWNEHLNRKEGERTGAKCK